LCLTATAILTGDISRNPHSEPCNQDAQVCDKCKDVLPQNKTEEKSDGKSSDSDSKSEVDSSSFSFFSEFTRETGHIPTCPFLFEVQELLEEKLTPSETLTILSDDFDKNENYAMLYRDPSVDVPKRRNPYRVMARILDVIDKKHHVELIEYIKDCRRNCKQSETTWIVCQMILQGMGPRFTLEEGQKAVAIWNNKA
jgi:hypothetical protein